MAEEKQGSKGNKPMSKEDYEEFFIESAYSMISKLPRLKRKITLMSKEDTEGFLEQFNPPKSQRHLVDGFNDYYKSVYNNGKDHPCYRPLINCLDRMENLARERLSALEKAGGGSE